MFRLHKLPFIVISMLLGVLSLSVVGCGGGGGGGGTLTPVTGRILRVETNQPPNPAGTINIDGAQATHGVDGTFSLNASASASSAIISAQGSQSRTLNITLSSSQTNNLGDIYLSDTGYTATLVGRVVTNSNGQNQAVGNANIVVAGARAASGTDGTFRITNLPIGLGTAFGVVGRITATGFEDKLISDATLQFPLITGNNDIGDILIAPPSGSTPLPPHTITGIVQVGGTPTRNLIVTLSSNGNNIGSVFTDANGQYSFWVVPGNYIVTANHPSNGSTQATAITLNQLDIPVTATTINFN